jgi:uncharacterized protein (TIGR02246 family)
VPNIFPSVPASSPEAVSAAFAAAINSRDLDAALELWVADAAIIRPDGDCTRGREAIAPALQALVDHDVTLQIDVANMFAAGEVAIATGTFTLRGTGADGHAFAERSSSVVVYARTANGWQIAIDAPWGLPRG